MSRLGGCAGAAMRLLATVLAIALALTLPLAVLAFDAGRVVFSPDEVAGIVTESGLESGALRRVVADRLLSPEAAGGTPEFNLARAMSFLEPDEVESVLDLLIPPEWARAQLSGVLAQLYEWVDNDQITPNVQLDIRPIQRGLLDGGAARLVETILDSWPACTVEQMDELTLANAPGGEMQLQYCEPPEPYRTFISDMAAQGLTEAARSMPPRIDLLPGPDQAPADASAVLALKEQLRLLRALTRWGWLLPLSLLGVIMALVVRSLRGLARWWGIPLLLGGLISILVALIFAGLVGGMISQALSESSMPEVVTRLLRGVVEGLRDRIMGRVFVHGLLITFGSGFLLLVGLLVGRRKPAAAPAPVARAVPGPQAPSGGAATGPKRGEGKPPPDAEKPTGMYG